MIARALRIAWCLLREIRPLPLPVVPGEFLELGQRALQTIRTIAELGPRPPNSDAHRELQQILSWALDNLNCELAQERFTAETPIGPVDMCNYIAKLGGCGPRTVVISGHYDTIHPAAVRPTGRAVRCRRALRQLLGRDGRPPSQYLGANDGGSSAGMLLEIARFLSSQSLAGNVWVVLFDGEEALVEWNTDDQTYGSRHQAAKWQRDGSLAEIDALINLDMIGSRDLMLAWELNSTRELSRLVWRVAWRCGYAARFPRRRGEHMGDDHIPFVRAGVPAVDLIDTEYGPGNGFWHTVEDSPDKLSAHCLGMVAHVLVGVLEELAIVRIRSRVSPPDSRAHAAAR